MTAFKIFIFLIIGSTAHAFAADRFAEPKWKATCQIGTRTVELKITSKSGHADDDDMDLQVSIDGKNQNLKYKPSLFTYDGLEKLKAGSACDLLPSYVIGDKAIILFAVDGRPNLDHLAALLIDVKNGRILDSSFDLGAIYELDIKKSNDGIRVKLNQGWKKKSTSDGPDNLLSGWKIINVGEQKIKATWEKALPTTHETYGDTECPYPAEPLNWIAKYCGHVIGSGDEIAIQASPCFEKAQTDLKAGSACEIKKKYKTKTCELAMKQKQIKAKSIAECLDGDEIKPFFAGS